MPVESKKDGNVPFLAGRSRYNILGLKPSWVYHRMASGNLNGAAPLQAGKTAAEVDPVVSAGRAEFSDLTEGGLFTLLGNYKKPVQVLEMDAAGATVTVVNRAGDSLRTVTSAPFRLAAGEYLKATGAAKAGFLVKIDGETII